LRRLAFSLAFRSDLCNGGSSDDTSYIFTHRPTINRAALPKSIGMPSSAGGNDLQPEPKLGACIVDRDLVDGDNRHSTVVFITASLMGFVIGSNMLYTDAIYKGKQDDYCGYNSLY
jgi:hypothetical protein